MEGKAICALTLRDLDPATLLSDVPTALCGEFANIRQGLHVFLFENESDLDVYDRNTTPKIACIVKGSR